jgi:methylated-DNA-[protein]-cysteine S-methyltransferase
MTAAFALVPAPWGSIHLAVTERGVAGLELLTPTADFIAAMERRLGELPVPLGDAPGAVASIGERTAERLSAFLAGEPDALSTLPIDLRTRSEWDRRVLVGVRQVPFGQVTSYGRLARMIGAPGAARAAGGAVGRNPIGLLIPCHRVIAGDGGIGGYGGAWWGSREQLLEIKRDLLAREGVRLPARTFVG